MALRGGLISRVGPRAATAYIAVQPDFSPFDRQVRDEMGRRKSRFTAIGRAAGLALGAGLAVAAVGAKKAVDAAVDLGEQINKTKVVFRGSEKEILRWSKSTASSIGTSRRAALEAAGTFGNMLVPMGFARDRAAEMSKRMVRLAADMASFNNASPQETLDALRAGLAGETEPLRRFGVFLNDARLKQEALNLGLKDAIGPTGALNANAKAQATYALILKDSADAQGDFGRTSGSLANQQRILSAQIENVGARVGKLLLPALQKGAQFASKFIRQMQTGKGAGGDFARVISDIAAGAKDAATTLRPVLADIGGFVIKHPEIAKAAGALALITGSLKIISRLSGSTGITGLFKVLSGGKLSGGIVSKATPVPVFVTNPGFGGGGKPGAPVGVLTKGGALATAMRFAGPVSIAVAGGVVLSEILGEPNRGPRPGREGARGIGGGRGEATERGRQATLDRLQPSNVKGDIESQAAVAQGAEELRARIQEVNRQIRAMSRDSGASIGNLRRQAVQNFREIERGIGLHTAEGSKAARRNFREAAEGIVESMKRGRGSTREGMTAIERLLKTHSREGKEGLKANMADAREAIASTMRRGGEITDRGLKLIRSLMVKELQLYGLNPNQALNIVKGGEGGFGNRGDSSGTTDTLGHKAVGGFVGMPGEAGRDLIPAMLGRGEAVLNRHQQAVVDMALGAVGMGGLDDLFSRVRRPHYLARGGIVGIPWAPGEQINSSILPLVTQLHNRFGVGVSDAFGPGHQSPGHTVHGTAVDFTGTPEQTDALVRWAVMHGYKTLYDGRFGSIAYPNHGPGNHAHVEFGGRVAALFRKLKRVQVGGPDSPLKSIVQGGLDRVRGAANKRLRNLMFSTAVVGGHTGAGNAANIALGRQMAARFGWTGPEWAALQELWTRESGWSNTARNPSSGAFGIPQALPPSKMGAAAVGGNAAAQIAWGLRYIRERYGSPSSALGFHNSNNWYARGGFVGRGVRAAKGLRARVHRRQPRSGGERLSQSKGAPIGLRHQLRPKGTSIRLRRRARLQRDSRALQRRLRQGDFQSMHGPFPKGIPLFGGGGGDAEVVEDVFVEGPDNQALIDAINAQTAATEAHTAAVGEQVAQQQVLADLIQRQGPETLAAMQRLLSQGMGRTIALNRGVVLGRPGKAVTL